MSDSDNAHNATDQMFALVGRCITQWSFVEETLCGIFSVCTGMVCARPTGGIDYLDSQVALSVFYSTESFRGKLNLVDAAVTSRLSISEADPEVFSAWGRLKDKTRKLSLKRNRLAHWTVLPAFEGDDDDEIHPARLVPPIGSPGYYRETGWRPTSATLSPVHVQHLYRAFYLVDEKLKEFRFSLARREELFDRYVRLLARQIRSLDHTDPTRAERLRRALSSLE